MKIGTILDAFFSLFHDIGKNAPKELHRFLIIFFSYFLFTFYFIFAF